LKVKVRFILNGATITDEMEPNQTLCDYLHDAAGATSVAVENLTVALNLTLLADWHVGAAPLAVSFQTQVKGGIPQYAYQWSFGDGSQSTLAAPTHTVKLRGLVSYEWVRDKRVVYETQRVTTAGRKSVAGADPVGFSSATCLLS